MMRRMRRDTLAAVLFLMVGAAVAAGCGDDDDPTGSGSDTNASAATGYRERLEERYKGTHREPDGPPVKPPPDKNIWVISQTLSAAEAVDEADAIRDATKALGWDLTVYDGQFNPTRMLNGIEQALADKADGIILAFIDCPPVRTGLEQAKRAGVPVVVNEGSDCSDLKPGDPELFDWVVRYGDMTFREWIQYWGAAQADWVIAKTDGKANTLVTVENDLETTRLSGKGAEASLKACSSCDYQVLEFTGDELGPKLQSKVEQALIKDPTIDSFIASYDSVLTSGAANALVASGRKDEIAIMGGTGGKAAIQLIHENNGNDACVGTPTTWEGYAAVDALVRIFLDRDPGEVNTGLGVQACDADHNLPPEGEPYVPPVDFAAAYNRLWGTN